MQPGQLSPDGRWRWDGTQWVPVAPAAPQRSRAWIWWLTGGCALILLVVLGGGAFAAYSIYNRVQHGGFSCLPSDFPKYPGETFGGENYSLNGATPGNACNMVFESNDSASSVYDFYSSNLDTGVWQVVSSDPGAGQIMFRNLKDPKTSGYVDVAAKGNHTEITVQLNRRP